MREPASPIGVSITHEYASIAQGVILAYDEKAENLTELRRPRSQRANEERAAARVNTWDDTFPILLEDHRMQVEQMDGGGELGHRAYYTSRWLFLRLLGLAYLATFVSLWTQLGGLLGRNGISPAGRLLDTMGFLSGIERFWMFPTVFWFDSGDTFLHVACLAGIAASVALLVGVAPPLALLTAWVVHLSFVTVGAEFVRFQSDVMLLEIGFFAVLLAPMQLFPRPSNERAPSIVMVWLLRLTLFRVLLTSGMALLFELRRQGIDALSFSFEGQTMPTPLGWYAHQLPGWVGQGFAVAFLVAAFAIPFTIILPRRFRATACVALCLFQMALVLGGYPFLQGLLTVALSILLIDDAQWARRVSRVLERRYRIARATRRALPGRAFAAGMVAAVALVVSAGQISVAALGEQETPARMRAVLRLVEPFHLVNRYDAFAHQTDRRTEIILEGSYDGRTWRAYEFRWKPGDTTRPLPWLEPGLGRLESQLVFAAATDVERNPWVVDLMERLLAGSPEVLALLEDNPFPRTPPMFVRAMRYEYRFSSLHAQRLFGHWWTRDLVDVYHPAITRPQSLMIAAAPGNDEPRA